MEIRYLLSKGFEICYLPEKFYQFYEVNIASKSLIPFKSRIKTSFNQISNSNPKVISSLMTRGMVFVQFWILNPISNIQSMPQISSEHSLKGCWALEGQEKVEIIQRKENFLYVFRVVKEFRMLLLFWIKHSAIEMSAPDDVNGLLNPKRIETATISISITYKCPLSNSLKLNQNYLSFVTCIFIDSKIAM